MSHNITVIYSLWYFITHCLVSLLFFADAPLRLVHPELLFSAWFVCQHTSQKRTACFECVSCCDLYGAEGWAFKSSLCSTLLKLSPQRASLIHPDRPNRIWHLWVLPTSRITAAMVKTPVAWRSCSGRQEDMIYVIFHSGWGGVSWRHRKLGPLRKVVK